MVFANKLWVLIFNDVGKELGRQKPTKAFLAVKFYL